MTPTSANTTWGRALAAILADGAMVAPRGKPTRELLHRTDVIDLRRPVVLNPGRSLSYRFMAAEAYWIISGANQLDWLTPYNQRMADYSDDGVTLYGAYGPPIDQQMEHVVESLTSDAESRQAVLTIWRPNPAKTKDVPCTVAMAFMLRGGRLNAHVFMRSNDVWLGWPYDVFSFSMVAHLVCCRLNARRNEDGLSMTAPLEPGLLYLTAASSHLYEPNWGDAQRCAADRVGRLTPETPAELFISEPHLVKTLKELRDTKPGDALRWWEIYQGGFQ